MNHIEQTLSELQQKIDGLIELRDAIRETFGMDRANPIEQTKPDRPEQATISVEDLPKIFGWEDLKLPKKLAQSRIAYWVKTDKIVRLDRGRYTSKANAKKAEADYKAKELSAEFKIRQVPKDIQEQIAASTRAMERAKESGNDALALLHQNRINTLKG